MAAHRRRRNEESSEISAVEAPVRMSSSTSHSRPVRRAAAAVRHGDPPVFAIPELLDETGDQAPGERCLALEDLVQGVADGGSSMPLRR